MVTTVAMLPEEEVMREIKRLFSFSKAISAYKAEDHKEENDKKLAAYIVPRKGTES